MSYVTIQIAHIPWSSHERNLSWISINVVTENEKKTRRKTFLQPKTTCTPATTPPLSSRKLLFVTYRVYRNSCCQTDTFLFLPQNIYRAFPCKTGLSDNEHYTGCTDWIWSRTWLKQLTSGRFCTLLWASSFLLDLQSRLHSKKIKWKQALWLVSLSINYEKILSWNQANCGRGCEM